MRWKLFGFLFLVSAVRADQCQITSPLPLPITGSFSVTASTAPTGPIAIYGVSGSTIPVGYSVTTSSYLPVSVQGTVPVSGSLSTTPGPEQIYTSSSGLSTVGWQVGGGTVPVAPAPGATFPISGSITTTALPLTTVTYNGSFQPVYLSTIAPNGSTVTVVTPSGINLAVSVNNTPTVSFNGTGQPIYSTGTIGVNGTVGISGTVPVSGNTTTSIALTTMTFNGTGQPIYSTGTLGVNVTNTVPVTGTFFQASQPVSQSGPFTINQGSGAWTVAAGTGNFNITGSISNTGFNVNNVPTVLISTAGVNSSTVAVVNAIGTNLGVTGTFFQGVQPVSQSAGWTVNQGSGAWTTTPGTGTWPVSGNVGQVGTSYTVTQGTGVITNPWSINFARPTTVNLSSETVNFTTTGSVTVVPGIASQLIRIFRMFLVVSAATNLTFEDSSTALTGAMNMTANGAIILDFDGEPWFVTSSGNGFVINQSGSAQISGRIYFTQS